MSTCLNIRFGRCPSRYWAALGRDVRMARGFPELSELSVNLEHLSQKRYCHEFDWRIRGRYRSTHSGTQSTTGRQSPEACFRFPLYQYHSVSTSLPDHRHLVLRVPTADVGCWNANTRH